MNLVHPRNSAPAPICCRPCAILSSAFRRPLGAFFVFITDGELFDLDEVQSYSRTLARDIAAGRRNPVKFVLIGLGPDVNERQLEELDDLDTGTDIDLWDHKLASELRMLQEIFAEVVDKNARVADSGRLLDAQGQVLKNYADTGLPAYLEFEIPNGNAYFTLEVNGNRIHQPLYDQAQVPPSQVSVPSASPAAPPPLPTQPAMPAAQNEALVDDVGAVSSDEDELWRRLDLRPAEEETENDGSGQSSL